MYVNTYNNQSVPSLVHQSVRPCNKESLVSGTKEHVFVTNPLRFPIVCTDIYIYISPWLELCIREFNRRSIRKTRSSRTSNSFATVLKSGLLQTKIRFNIKAWYLSNQIPLCGAVVVMATTRDKPALCIAWPGENGGTITQGLFIITWSSRHCLGDATEVTQ